LVAALDIKTRDVPTVSSINSLLSQYCKASHFFLQIFIYRGRAPTVRFAPVVPWAKTGPDDKEENGRAVSKDTIPEFACGESAELRRHTSRAEVTSSAQPIFQMKESKLPVSGVRVTCCKTVVSFTATCRIGW
jgi:hypothetical protein